jgi:hypothetical protein
MSKLLGQVCLLGSRLCGAGPASTLRNPADAWKMSLEGPGYWGICKTGDPQELLFGELREILIFWK